MWGEFVDIVESKRCTHSSITDSVFLCTPIQFVASLPEISQPTVMNRNFIRRHMTSISILLYLALFISVQAIQPAFLYGHDGSIRPFGIGYSKSTIVPMWGVTIMLAIIAYYAVMYYLALPRMKI